MDIDTDMDMDIPGRASVECYLGFVLGWGGIDRVFPLSQNRCACKFYDYGCSFACLSPRECACFKNPSGAQATQVVL